MQVGTMVAVKEPRRARQVPALRVDAFNRAHVIGYLPSTCVLRPHLRRPTLFSVLDMSSQRHQEVVAFMMYRKVNKLQIQLTGGDTGGVVV